MKNKVNMSYRGGKITFLALALAFSCFALGVFSTIFVGILYAEGSLEGLENYVPITGFFVSQEEIPLEASAPSNYLGVHDVVVGDGYVKIFLINASLSEYADSGSMDPVLNSDSMGIRIVPDNEDSVRVGDIISFENKESLIVHRVIEKGYDESGLYFVTKGDNNNFPDGKIRFESIKYKVVGILY